MVTGYKSPLPKFFALAGEVKTHKRYGVILGVDYPGAIVDLLASAKRNERIYNGISILRNG